MTQTKIIITIELQSDPAVYITPGNGVSENVLDAHQYKIFEKASRDADIYRGWGRWTNARAVRLRVDTNITELKP